MRDGRTEVGARYALVCEVEDTDRSAVEQISWCKVVHVPSRPFGQKTNLLSQHCIDRHPDNFDVTSIQSLSK